MHGSVYSVEHRECVVVIDRNVQEVFQVLTLPAKGNQLQSLLYQYSVDLSNFCWLGWSITTRKVFAIINNPRDYSLCLVSAYFNLILTPTKNLTCKDAVTIRLAFVKLDFDWGSLKFVTLLLGILRPRYIENLNIFISKVTHGWGLTFLQ